MTTFVFGQVRPSITQVFYTTPLSRGVVNLKPVVPGHVLVIPKRKTLKFSELTAEEVSDLWLAAQKIGSVIETHYNATSLTFALQDGPDAGQTIHHVHVRIGVDATRHNTGQVHVIPRRPGDFTPNDTLYHELEKDRPARSEEEMEKEALELKVYFPDCTP